MRAPAALEEEGGGQPPQCSTSLVAACCPGPGPGPGFPPSWTPRAASSCWEALLLRTRSWGRSPRRTPTRQCLWSWCTVCCQTTGSWPGAGWSPSPSPGRALKPASPEESGVSHEQGEARAPLRSAPLRSAPPHPAYLAAPAVRFASSGRRYPAGACGFFASCTGCTL